MFDSGPTKELDPTRKYAIVVPFKNEIFFTQITNDGVQRPKRHMVGGYKNGIRCPLVLDRMKLKNSCLKILKLKPILK